MFPFLFRDLVPYGDGPDVSIALVVCAGGTNDEAEFVIADCESRGVIFFDELVADGGMS